MRAISRLRTTAIFAVAGVMFTLAGCGGNAFQATKQQVNDVAQKAAALQRETEASNTDVVPAGQVHMHHRAFGGGRALVNDHGEPLPPRADHFLLDTKGVGLKLREIAAEINAQTGLPVDVMDDIPVGVARGVGPGTGQSEADCRMAPDYQGKLERFLDGLATYCDLSWNYSDGRVKLQVYETATYRLYAVPTMATIKSMMSSQGAAPTTAGGGGAAGGGGMAGAGATSGITATGQSLEADVTYDTKLDSWTEIKKLLTALVKPGIVEVSKSERTILVVGRHSAQVAAKRLITEINRRQLRQVDFTVQVLNLTTSDNIDLGLSLNTLLNQLQGQYVVQGASPTALAATGAGALGVTVQNNTLTNKTNKWATSAAVISALQNIGNVATRDTLTISARDGRPAPVTVARQLAYVSSATSQLSTVAALGGLQESTLTIGLTMNLLPMILDDGQVLLQYAFGLSSLNDMTSVTSDGITLQTPDINVRSSLQEAVLSSGDALVLLGYQQESLNEQDQGIPGLADKLFGFFGGSKSVANTHTALVIIITPQVRENRVSGT